MPRENWLGIQWQAEYNEAIEKAGNVKRICSRGALRWLANSLVQTIWRLMMKKYIVVEIYSPHCNFPQKDKQETIKAEFATAKAANKDAERRYNALITPEGVRTHWGTHYEVRLSKGGL